MQITEEQYALIKDSLPVQRDNVGLLNRQLLNAALCVLERGANSAACRALRRPIWIYTRMNCCSKSGVRDRVFERLLLEQTVRVKIEAFALDSTSVKVHSDGTGALKKRTAVHWQEPRRLERQDISGCRKCSNGESPFALARPGA